MRNIFRTVLWVLVIAFMVDFACFIWWTMSGQKPVDSFYVGAISANIIKGIIK